MALVILELCSSQNDVAVRKVERRYGVAARSARFMFHRFRETMSHDDGKMFDGNVVADEVYIGGNAVFMHANKRHGHAGAGTDKTPVVTLTNTESREARSTIVSWIDSASLGDIIRENVDIATTFLYTDSRRGDIPVNRTMAGHHAVNHRTYVDATNKTIGSNLCENYFARLKRGLKGTHIHVGPRTCTATWVSLTFDSAHVT